MKILIVCSKWSYKYIDDIKKRLELLGHEVILPNSYDDPMKEEKIKKEMTKQDHIAFVRECYNESINKIKNSDATLVLNFNKFMNSQLYRNYIGGATFLEMYDSYILGHDIYLYNDIPKGMLYDEIEGMNPIVIKGNLFKLDKDYKKFKNNNLSKYFSEKSLNYISLYTPYEKAKRIVDVVFKDKKDKAGRPYLEHLYRVSDKLDSEIEKVAGLLHDIVEDTDITYYDLIEIGFPIEIVEIVKLVTKEKSKYTLSKEGKLKVYNEKIDQIIESGNISAIRLKESDMSDNYDLERLKALPQDKQEWFKEKYEKQLIKLRKTLNKERND